MLLSLEERDKVGRRASEDMWWGLAPRISGLQLPQLSSQKVVETMRTHISGYGAMGPSTVLNILQPTSHISLGDIHYSMPAFGHMPSQSSIIFHIFSLLLTVNTELCWWYKLPTCPFASLGRLRFPNGVSFGFNWTYFHFSTKWGCISR